MYRYRVQIKKINHCQVDIESETPINIDEMFAMAEEAGRREFGASDETEIVQVEKIEH